MHLNIELAKPKVLSIGPARDDTRSIRLDTCMKQTLASALSLSPCIFCSGAKATPLTDASCKCAKMPAVASSFLSTASNVASHVRTEPPEHICTPRPACDAAVPHSCQHWLCMSHSLALPLPCPALCTCKQPYRMYTIASWPCR